MVSLKKNKSPSSLQKQHKRGFTAGKATTSSPVRFPSQQPDVARLTEVSSALWEA